ncbi:deaminase-reductase domain-containing protein [Companilactobacillus kimchiensis]|uniref:Deaminase-reductase domain-containing protein n=2 Tax=Companilactobacillus kimchiensis TaxID=993692 RepID=A0A0R2LFX3_9LACO|nr:deaminase-reductase domain-containing protein [Companilactobacillus kimchiensis]
MMMSVDGRIDCDMTAQLPGTTEYYQTLQAIDAPTTLSGRVTAQLELAQSGKFDAENKTAVGVEKFSKKVDSKEYNVVVDTKGTLMWDDDAQYSRPHIIITSQQVTKDYLDYLDTKNISWIVAGESKIDLARATEILKTEFEVERMAIVGGGHIDGSFLDEGLIDEISLLIGAGVDGRGGMAAVFDGRGMDHGIVPLKLKSVQSYDDDAVWLRYLVKK